MDTQLNVRTVRRTPAYLRRAFGDVMRCDPADATSHGRAVRLTWEMARASASRRVDLRPTVRRMVEAVAQRA